MFMGHLCEYVRFSCESDALHIPVFISFPRFSNVFLVFTRDYSCVTHMMHMLASLSVPSRKSVQNKQKKKKVESFKVTERKNVNMPVLGRVNCTPQTSVGLEKNLVFIGKTYVQRARLCSLYFAHEGGPFHTGVSKLHSNLLVVLFDLHTTVAGLFGMNGFPNIDLAAETQKGVRPCVGSGKATFTLVFKQQMLVLCSSFTFRAIGCVTCAPIVDNLTREFLPRETWFQQITTLGRMVGTPMCRVRRRIETGIHSVLAALSGRACIRATMRGSRFGSFSAMHLSEFIHTKQCIAPCYCETPLHLKNNTTHSKGVRIILSKMGREEKNLSV